MLPTETIFQVAGVCTVAIALSGTAAGCLASPEFHCDEQRTCGAQGVCEETGYCSFPDSACPSGRRYGELASDQLRDECVDSSGRDPGDTCPAGQFAPPTQLLSAPAVGGYVDPALSSDGLALYFADQLGNLLVSERASLQDAFSEVERVPGVPAGEGAGPSPSTGSLELYFESDREDETLETEIYVAVRGDTDQPFSEGAPVTGLSSSSVDESPSIAADRAELYFASERRDDFTLDLYAAALLGPGVASQPRLLPISDDDADDTDPWITADGRHIYFVSDRDGSPAIYVAARGDLQSDFNGSVRLDELTVGPAIGGPTVSAAEDEIYFSAGAVPAIWTARRCLPTSGSPAP